MTTWLHEERLEAARDAIVSSGATSILDLGCGDGDLLIRLLDEPRIERILAVDICQGALDRLRRRLRDRKARSRARVELRQGSMTDPRNAFAGFDCAILIETIEHIAPERLSSLERAVFVANRPRSVVITTPNAEFNALLGVPNHRLRRPDHRFEWSRARFRRWAEGVGARTGYAVDCRDIAGRHPDLGGASQMATFRDLSAQPSRLRDNVSASLAGPCGSG